MDDDLIEIAPTSDESERTAFGAIDKLIVNGAMIAACLLPTIMIGLFKPWKLAPLITADAPTGRRGLILAPGLFFLVAIIAAVSLAGLSYSATHTEVAAEQTEGADENPTVFGMRDSLAVVQSIAEGDFSKAILLITPFFLLAVFSAILSRAARPLLDTRWTLVASIRAWLYYTGIAISLMFAAFAVTEILMSQSDQSVRYSGDVPMLIFLAYFFGSLFRFGFNATLPRALAATAACLISYMLLLVGILVLVHA